MSSNQTDLEQHSRKSKENLVQPEGHTQENLHDRLHEVQFMIDELKQQGLTDKAQQAELHTKLENEYQTTLDSLHQRIGTDHISVKSEQRIHQNLVDDILNFKNNIWQHYEALLLKQKNLMQQSKTEKIPSGTNKQDVTDKIPQGGGSYKDRFLGITYEMAIKNREVIEGFKRNIEVIKQILQKKDIGALKELVKGKEKKLDNGSQVNWDKVFDFERIDGILQSESLDDELLTMWSIGMWLIKEQPVWKSNMDVLKKIWTQRKGSHFLDDITKEDEVGNCMDSASAALLLAEEFALPGGQIRSLHGVHRYYDNGTFAIDTWWSQKTGGLVRAWEPKDKETWINPALPQSIGQHLCGGEISPSKA